VIVIIFVVTFVTVFLVLFLLFSKRKPKTNRETNKVINSLNKNKEIIKENWVEYIRTSNGNVFFYDKDSVNHPSDEIVQILNIVYYSDEGKKKCIQEYREQGNRINCFDKLSYTTSLLEINCKDLKYKTLSIVDYDTDGELLFKGKPYQPDWDHIYLDTGIDKLVKIFSPFPEPTFHDRPEPITETRERNWVEDQKCPNRSGYFYDKDKVKHPSENIVKEKGGIMDIVKITWEYVKINTLKSVYTLLFLFTLFPPYYEKSDGYVMDRKWGFLISPPDMELDFITLIVEYFLIIFLGCVVHYSKNQLRKTK